MIWTKLAMHEWYETNNIRIWHIRSYFLSPSMFIAHVNGCCVEICANIKLSFLLHVPISLKKISFNIVGHGMDMIVEVLSPMCEPYLFANLWQWIWWWKSRWRSFWKTMSCWYVWAYETGWYLLHCEKKKDHNQPSSSSTPVEKTFTQMGDIMQEIINEVKEGKVQLIDRTTSLLHVIAIDVWGIRPSKVNEVMHLSMVFHCVNDGLGNLVHRMKDWMRAHE